MNQYQSEFQLELQEYQVNQQARQQQMSELWFAMDLMSFETPAQQQEREWNYRVKQQEYQNGDINSKDYSTRYKAALKWVENLLSQYEWIPMQRSAEQMAQDVLKAIDNWSTLWEELTKINKQIQSKPEYKYMYNQTFKPESVSNDIKYETFSLNGTDYIIWNNQLLTADAFNNQFWGKNSVSPEIMWKWLTAFENRMQSLVDKWWAIRQWWCGEPVNDYLKSIWSNVSYDDKLQTKLDSITPWAWPKIWSIAIWDWTTFNSPDAKKYGHVAIVTWIDEKNWTITVLESNWQAQKMGMWYWVYNMNNVTWYFDPSAWYTAPNSEWITWNTNLTDTEQPSFSSADGVSNDWQSIIPWWNMETPQFNTKNPYSWVIGRTSNWAEINAGGWITSLERSYWAKLTDKQREKIEQSYWITTKIFNEQAERYMDYIETQEMVNSLIDVKERAEKLKAWAEDENNKSLKGTIDLSIAEKWYPSFWENLVTFDDTVERIQEWKSLFDNLMSNAGFQKYLQMRNDWAQFWIMTDSEWNKIDKSIAPLKWEQKDDLFLENINSMIKGYDDVLRKLWYTWEEETVVEPNMSEFQNASVNDLWSWLLSRTINGITQYSYDWWRTRN